MMRLGGRKGSGKKGGCLGMWMEYDVVSDKRFSHQHCLFTSLSAANPLDEECEAEGQVVCHRGRIRGVRGAASGGGGKDVHLAARARYSISPCCT